MCRAGPVYDDTVESVLPLEVGDIPIAEYVLAYPTGPDNVEEGFEVDVVVDLVALAEA